MQCFICVTYLMIIVTARPPKVREISKTVEKRSIFNDVIQSLRMRAQIPEDINLSDENNLGLNYDKYGIENESLQLPNDLDFMPRRNDRIEMPPMKNRFPKSLMGNDSFDNAENPKEEIVLYVNTPGEFSEINPTTQKPKKQKRPRPPVNKNKNTLTINKSEEDATQPDSMMDKPFMNTMAGQSQIGNRESQTVVKPTVIVNFRGSVMHRESDIRLERRRNNNTVIPQNIFNINQEIKVERNDARMQATDSRKKLPVNVKQNVNIQNPQVDEDMMMCETSSSKEKEDTKRSDRKYDVLQIRFTI